MKEEDYWKGDFPEALDIPEFDRSCEGDVVHLYNRQSIKTNGPQKCQDINT